MPSTATIAGAPNGNGATTVTPTSTTTTTTTTTIASTFDEKLTNSLEVLRETFRRYTPDQLFVSFNGGKDCTVLLHMVDTVFRQLEPNSTTSTTSLLCLYLQSEQPFDEIEQFVDAAVKRYAIRLERSAPGLRKQQALFDLCQQHPAAQACLMGCRRSDPWCAELGTFEATTEGWPPLMRVNPLLDWTCADIWDYVERFAVPYCSLYDQGYTSLGDRSNTLPNPHLRYVDDATGLVCYRPAHTLRHSDELERVGRFVSTTTTAKDATAAPSS